MKRMLEPVFALLVLTASGLAMGDTPCSAIDGDDARPPLSVDNGTFCFKLQPLLDSKGNLVLGEDRQIHVYSIQQGREAVKLGELPYLARTGNVEDAFQLDVNQDGKNDVVVIHSAEIRRSHTGGCQTSPWYSTLVYMRKEAGFEYDGRASGWFGDGFDFVEGESTPGIETCDDDKLMYVHPYKTRDAVEKAISGSPFTSLTTDDTPLAATVIRKSWLSLYDDFDSKTNKYLIAGDKVLVNRVTKGVCQITYSGGKKPLQMWMQCDALKLDSENTK
jgi:hypothetical protein